MVIGLLIISLLVLLLITLLNSRVKMVCSVTISQEVQTLSIAVYFYRVCLMKRAIDLSDETEQEQSIRQTLSFLRRLSNDFIQKTKNTNAIVQILLKRTRFHTICWITEAGTGKADTTGMMTGGIWALKGMVIGVLSGKSHLLCEPSVIVKPLFNRKHVHSSFDCMISMKAGQAIYALLKIIRRLPVKPEAII